jgi:ATP-dependent Clp protease adaptor protein ClpS
MSENDNFRPDEHHEGHVVTANEVKTKKPPRYKVLLHNDDYTTMEFVVVVLQKFFHKKSHEAEQIMLKIHTEGIGICGIYTYEVAESKQAKVAQYAKDHQHPLVCTIEPE